MEKTPIHFKSDVTFVDAKKSLVSTIVSALYWTCWRSGKGICTLCSRWKTWADLCWHHRRSWGFIRALNLPDADVDDNEDYDEGFEDEDYDRLLCLINWRLSDQVYI